MRRRRSARPNATSRRCSRHWRTQPAARRYKPRSTPFTGCRFAAAKAYGRILEARIEGLREGPTALGSTIGRYLSNRVDPALATCLAIEKRLETLAGKIERAIELLNVRIGLDLQIQNKSVLETIASTAQSQFRLQATVEGLSVIAISYYALGILSYVLAGPLEFVHFDKALAVCSDASTVWPATDIRRPKAAGCGWMRHRSRCAGA